MYKIITYSSAILLLGHSHVLAMDNNEEIQKNTTTSIQKNKNDDNNIIEIPRNSKETEKDSIHSEKNKDVEEEVENLIRPLDDKILLVDNISQRAGNTLEKLNNLNFDTNSITVSIIKSGNTVDNKINSRKVLIEEKDVVHQVQNFDFKNWLGQKLNDQNIDVNINAQPLKEKIHRLHVKQNHVFNVPYRGNQAYNGTQNCNKSFTFSTCDNVVNYQGRVQYQGQVEATCTQFHHDCLCEVLSETVGLLRKTHNEKLDVEKKLNDTIEKNNKLKEKIKKDDEVILQEVISIKESAILPINKFNELHNSQKNIITILEILSDVNKVLRKQSEVVKDTLVDRLSITKNTIDTLTIESENQKEKLRKELTEEREKINKQSIIFAKDLTDKQQDFFQKIMNDSRILSDKFEQKIEKTNEENKNLLTKINLLSLETNKLEMKLENAKTSCFQVLKEAIKGSSLSKEFMNKYDKVKQELRTSNFQDILDLISDYLLEK